MQCTIIMVNKIKQYFDILLLSNGGGSDNSFFFFFRVFEERGSTCKITFKKHTNIISNKYSTFQLRKK